MKSRGGQHENIHSLCDVEFHIIMPSDDLKKYIYSNKYAAVVM